MTASVAPARTSRVEASLVLLISAAVVSKPESKFNSVAVVVRLLRSTPVNGTNDAEALVPLLMYNVEPAEASMSENRHPGA